MLPDGPHKRLFYLSIDFVRNSMMTPMQEIYQQQVTDAYPDVAELALQQRCGRLRAGAVSLLSHRRGSRRCKQQQQPRRNPARQSVAIGNKTPRCCHRSKKVLYSNIVCC